MADWYGGSDDDRSRYGVHVAMWEETADAANNRSYVRYQFSVYDNNPSYGGTGYLPWSCSFAGNSWSGTAYVDFAGNSGNSYLLIDTGAWIGHDTNGNGSVYGDGYAGPASPMGNAGTAGTLGLTNFNRAPDTPSSVTTTVNADKSITVNVAAVSSPAGTPTYHVQYSMEGGAFTGEQTSTGTSFTFSGLTAGKNYVFRAWATNSDGSSGTRNSASVFLPSGGRLFNGTAWVPAVTSRIYDGTSWRQIITARIYDGTSWRNMS